MRKPLVYLLVTISASQCKQVLSLCSLTIPEGKAQLAKQNKKFVGLGSPKLRHNKTDLRRATIHSSKQRGQDVSPRNVGLSPCLLNLQEEQLHRLLNITYTKGGLRRRKKESQHLELSAAPTNTSTLRFTIGLETLPQSSNRKIETIAYLKITHE